MSAFLVSVIVLGAIAAVLKIALDDVDQRATAEAPGGRAAIRPAQPLPEAPPEGAAAEPPERLRAGVNLVLLVVAVGAGVAVVIGALVGLAALSWLPRGP